MANINLRVEVKSDTMLGTVAKLQEHLDAIREILLDLKIKDNIAVSTECTPIDSTTGAHSEIQEKM